MDLTPIDIPSSKSLSNRYLILKFLFPNLKLKNLSSAKDTQILEKSLKKLSSDKTNDKINIGHAGTAMRFLTALLSLQSDKRFILDGSERMRQRPIKILVEALQQLGADITYLKNEGFPPLAISGTKLLKEHITIAQNVSSQYITALLLIAPALPNGLKIHLTGKQVSKPYIQMTIAILKDLGIKVIEKEQVIEVYKTKNITTKTINIEGDWSSASYFYGAAAVLKQKLIIQKFNKQSIQGDRWIMQYFQKLGIESQFIEENKLLLRPIPNFIYPKKLSFDLINTPDLAQTLATTCLALGIKCHLTGLQTLKIKETDRLQALKNEMEKFGATVQISHNELKITTPIISRTNITIDTYEDHRMAMSFAILKLLYPQICINNPGVVEKSFPDFWEKFQF